MLDIQPPPLLSKPLHTRVRPNARDERPAHAAHPLPPTGTASLGLHLAARRDTWRERAVVTDAGARVGPVGSRVFDAVRPPGLVRHLFPDAR